MIVRTRRGNNAWSPLHRALRIAALEAALQDDAELAGPRLVLVARTGGWSFADQASRLDDGDRPGQPADRGW